MAKDNVPRRYRLAIVATHPIQYQVPIYRALASDPEIDLHVFFASDHSVRGRIDDGFGVRVAWDVPMLEGYEKTFLKNRPLPFWPRSAFRYCCPALGRRLAAGRLDAVLVSGYSTMLDWQAIFAAIGNRIPVLLRGDNKDVSGPERNSPKRALRTCLLKTLYRKLSAGLAVGSYMVSHFARHGLPEHRIYWSPHCVDNMFFRQLTETTPPSEDTRRGHALVDCAMVALFCGKLVPKKAPLLLVEALGLMKHRDKMGFLVVGDGELRREMETAVAQAGIMAYAFVGFKNQTELPRFYGAADFLVLPSSWGETWGLVVNEAMNFGLPAIVSDHVGCAEDLVKNGETGYIFPAGDAKALAEKLDRMVANREHTKEMGRRARKLVDSFSVERAAAGVKGALKAVARHRGR